MTTTSMTAIERLKASRRDFMEIGAAGGNRLIRGVSSPCDPPEGDYVDFDDATEFGKAWAERGATYEQLRALEHLATLVGMQATPQLDTPDPACWLIAMLSEVDDFELEPEDYGRLKADWFGVNGGGVTTQRQVEGWIAGALEYWRTVKDAV